MDPLSDVLSLMKIHTYVSGAFDAAGDWAISFEAYEGMRFYAAIAGECWLVVEGVPDPVRVRPGDCLLLPRGRPFRVASDLQLEPVDVNCLTNSTFEEGGTTLLNGGGEFSSVGGHFTMTGEQAGVLIDLLPPIVHIRSEADKAMLRWCIDRMRHELREPQLGGFLVAQQLAILVLVGALRLHLADVARGGTGWLFALSDPQMAAAMRAMHDDPAQRWTVQSLARCAGMSRTSFTLKFKETVGTAPMEYLARWRMTLAGDRLANSGDSVSQIALALGYESESAFSTAFKRLKGASPREYSRRNRGA